MTENKRAKRDARARQERTGERYVAARRRSSKQQERLFKPDCCANCLERLPDEVESLFCSELCMQTCDTVRYWRRVRRDGRIERADVREAVKTRVAFLFAGGYGRTARQLAPHTRAAVWARDRGLCRTCGQPGEEIDHIDGDSPALVNLQLLCKDCHHAKTAERMVPAPDAQQRTVAQLFTARVAPAAPALLADDEIEWRRTWSRLKNERRQRLLDAMVDAGLNPSDYRGASRAEMVADLEDATADWGDDDYDGDPGNYDGGYGPNSYFARAMAKDD